MNKFTKIMLSLVCLVMLVSCERYPITDVTNINPKIKVWPTTFYVYDDEIRTKGSFDPVIWAGSRFLQNPSDKDVLEFDCTDGAMGYKCIKMSWNDCEPYQFAGWGLSVTEDQIGRTDMSKSDYNCLEFYAKGYLTEGCLFEVVVPSDSVVKDAKVLTASDLSNNWTRFEIPLTMRTTNYWHSMQYYVSVNMYRENSVKQTNGGTVYIDNIRYCKK